MRSRRRNGGFRKLKNSAAKARVPKKGPRNESVSWVGRLAPFNGRLVEAKCLYHKNARLVEVLRSCAGPISGRAGGAVAIAAQRNPVSSSQYVTRSGRYHGV